MKFHTMATDSLSFLRSDFRLKMLKPIRSSVTNLDSVLFIEMKDSYRAQLIADLYHGKRFPIREEWLCNLSDPGFSWWLIINDDGSLTIRFQSYGIDDSSKRQLCAQ